MESSNSLKNDQSIGNKAIINRDSYGSGGDQDFLSGFSWPPRSYTCSFCRREFRSAQALGGHMNVHRRDRARLRQYSPPPPPRDITDHHHSHYPLLNLNLNPNPNPKNFSIPSSPLVSPPPSTLSSVSSPSSAAAAAPSFETKKWGFDGTLVDPYISPKRSARSFFNIKDFDHHQEADHGCSFSKKAHHEKFVRLDLEIGLISNSKEDLDLELRLGYS